MYKNGSVAITVFYNFIYKRKVIFQHEIKIQVIFWFRLNINLQDCNCLQYFSKHDNLSKQTDNMQDVNPTLGLIHLSITYIM